MKQSDTSPEYRIRNYKRGDYEGISKLWECTGLGNPRRGDDEKTIEKTIRMGGRLLVVEEMEHSRICGSSWMTFVGRRIHLHHFGISPDHQGKGLAGKLLGKSLDYVKKKGYQVKIEVHRSNKKAISIYKKAGFEYLGDYDVYIIRDLLSLK